MRKFQEEERASIVAGWPAARAAGETEVAYAIRNGISDRSLRAWCRRLGPVKQDAREVRVVVETVLRVLHKAEAQLRRVLDDAPASVDPAGVPVGSSGSTVLVVDAFSDASRSEVPADPHVEQVAPAVASIQVPVPLADKKPRRGGSLFRVE